MCVYSIMYMFQYMLYIYYENLKQGPLPNQGFLAICLSSVAKGCRIAVSLGNGWEAKAAELRSKQR